MDENLKVSPHGSNALVMGSFSRFRDIPQFPFASYHCNVGWSYLEEWLDGHKGATSYTIELNPDYQRGYVWSQEQKEKYIEYRLKGGFSGKDIYWNCPNWMHFHKVKNAKLELVDGKQRIDAVIGFMNDEVKAFGKFKSEFEDKMPFTIDFVFHINNLVNRREVIEWYLGLNRGGSVHTEKDLQPAYEALKNCP